MIQPRQESAGTHAAIELMAPAKVSLEVWLDGCQMRLGDLLQLSEGQIVKLDHPLDRKAVCTLNGSSGFQGQIVPARAGRSCWKRFAGKPGIGPLAYARAILDSVHCATPRVRVRVCEKTVPSIALPCGRGSVTHSKIRDIFRAPRVSKGTTADSQLRANCSSKYRAARARSTTGLSRHSTTPCRTSSRSVSNVSSGWTCGSSFFA